MMANLAFNELIFDRIEDRLRISMIRKVRFQNNLRIYLGSSQKFLENIEIETRL